MVNVGDVDIQYVEELSVNNFSKNTVDIEFNGRDPLSKNISKQLTKLNMSGVTVTDQYGVKTYDNYIEDIIAIAERNEAYNYINFGNTKGFISLTKVTSPTTAEKMNMREYSATGSFYPINSYMREFKLDTEYEDNDFAISYSPLIACPVYAYNFIVKTPWSSLPLDAYAYVYGNEGSIPIIKPFPVLNTSNYTTNTGDIVALEEAEGGAVYEFDANAENIKWSYVSGQDIPLGVYNLIFRIRESDLVADDIKIVVTVNTVDVITETFVAGTTNFETIQTSDFQLLTLGQTIDIVISKATATSNTIEIDYGFVNPDFSAYLLFDCDDELDAGEIKIYDTCGNIAETEWVQIYNKNHAFNERSDFVIQNSLFRWTIDLSATWGNTGEFKNLYTEDIGYLYPYSYQYDDVRMRFIEIRPDYVELEIHLNNVSEDSAAANATQVVTVKIDPIRFSFDVVKYGATKFDWFLDYTDNDDFKGTYYPDSHFVNRADAAATAASANGASIGIFDSFALIIGKSTDGNVVYDSDGVYLTDGTTATSEDYSFILSAINNFEGVEYLYKTVMTGGLSFVQTINPITHSDFALSDSAFKTDAYSLIAGTAGHWTWSTDHLECKASTDLEIQILRSYQYSPISNLKIDTFPVDDTLDGGAFGGIIFGYQDSNNYLRAGLYNESYFGLRVHQLFMVTDGVELVLDDTIISGGEIISQYTIDIDILDSIINVYIYAVGGSRSVTPELTSAADNKRLSGFVGIVAGDADTADNITVTFNNFETSGTELHAPRGVQKNKVIDDLTYPSLAEFEHDTSDAAQWTEDDDLCFTATGNDVGDGTKETVDALISNVNFDNGNIRGLVRINSAEAVDRYGGFLFCSPTSQNGYLLNLEIDSTDNCFLNLQKLDSSAVAAGTYGYAGYGVAGYGGVAVIATLNYTDLVTTYVVGDWVWLECDYVDGVFNCYHYAYGATKPTTATMSYTPDTTYTYGRIGLYARVSAAGADNLDVSFRNLRINNTTECNSGVDTFATIGGVNHGSLIEGGEVIYLFTRDFGTDLQLGVYLLGSGYINTDKETGNASLTAQFINTDDTTGVDLGSADTTEDIASSVVWGDYTNTLLINDDDDGDSGNISIKRKSDTDYDERLSLISFIGVIPVSNISSGDNLFTTDLVFDSFNNHSLERMIDFREMGGFLIKRFDGNYGEL